MCQGAPSYNLYPATMFNITFGNLRREKTDLRISIDSCFGYILDRNENKMAGTVCFKVKVSNQKKERIVVEAFSVPFQKRNVR